MIGSPIQYYKIEDNERILNISLQADYETIAFIIYEFDINNEKKNMECYSLNYDEIMSDEELYLNEIADSIQNKLDITNYITNKIILIIKYNINDITQNRKLINYKE